MDFLLSSRYKNAKNSLTLYDQMKLSIYMFYLFFGLFFSTTDVNEDVIAALKSGKASELVKYFDERVSIKIINQEDVLSKAQAEANLNFFFEKHSVKNFITTGNSASSNNSAQYINGSMETSNGKFKVSILIKRNLVTQLRIENYNE